MARTCVIQCNLKNFPFGADSLPAEACRLFRSSGIRRTGQKKKKKKCGFKTKKEALEWESEFKLSANANMDMKLIDFVEIYFRDKSGELKERTIKNKRYIEYSGLDVITVRL